MNKCYKSLEQIKANAPDEEADGYEIVDGKVYYFIGEFFIWDDNTWKVCIFNEGYKHNIKPL